MIKLGPIDCQSLKYKYKQRVTVSSQGALNGENLKVGFLQLTGDGGGIVPNINRWRVQLGLEPQLQQEIENSMVDKEGLLGMYKIINIMNDQDNSAFLAAIIPLEKHTLFAKLSINISGIADVESDFIEFCSSINIVQ